MPRRKRCRHGVVIDLSDNRQTVLRQKSGVRISVEAEHFAWSNGSGVEVNCAAGSKVIRCLVEARWVARLVIRVSIRNPNHQPFPRSREQNSIFVSDEVLSDRLLDLLPTGANQTSNVPRVGAPSKITAPTDADPIQFESLTFKFWGLRVLEWVILDVFKHSIAS